MELRGFCVILGILLLSRGSSQQLSSRKAAKKDTTKDPAMVELQKQIKDIVQELNLLKEQQALQTGDRGSDSGRTRRASHLLHKLGHVQLPGPSARRGMSENCAVLSGASQGKWFDENCREERPSVCQFNIV
ncbi:hypothetical protein OJAV_G00114850 [Oryzias javanicus]|uniref:C-type lectin domain-containing protein n=1 Tax=Oryzias javanicus TaxID=123683 RepID=A0A3S2M3F6_ORYJA|nr:hypothetical protein OJAV_G00114850 [Oryzias javanicus]